ncbi:uncharacterized protein LOC119602603 [Lucilia sericata]|uniref:uncharacterized protein LOC119602603 n=1 Tax=Lucilia sericata TaxID=13632 RepID=UPI0018A84844|nr:uncharacterized protein LOC119602603 [Lucilia sericata]
MSASVIKFILMASLTAGVYCSSTDRNPKKRQIYREQVLPHAGGRIPDTAFETDRLFLNQLQKDGIAVPDGIVPEQRNPQVYPFFNRPSRKVFRIALSSDGRFTPEEGRFHNQELPSVETTYLYPQIHGHRGTLEPQTIELPVYSPFRVHNPLLNQVKFQPKDKAQFRNVNPGFSGSKSIGNPKSYQNVQLLNTPLSSTFTSKTSSYGKHYLPNYSTTSSSHLFNEFDELFNQFEIYDGEIKKTNAFTNDHVTGAAASAATYTYGHLFHPPTEEHHHKQEKQDLNKIPGVPGVDYPVYHEVPHTSFSCAHVPATPGMYANVETGCQAYHVCHDGREGHQGASFLCTNGTIFNQKEFACDWWYNVKCEEAVNYYHLNADPEHNPYTPKKKIVEEQHFDHHAHADAHGFLIHA